jgi:hypothetical protein
VFFFSSSSLLLSPFLKGGERGVQRLKREIERGYSEGRRGEVREAGKRKESGFLS